MTVAVGGAAHRRQRPSAVVARGDLGRTGRHRHRVRHPRAGRGRVSRARETARSRTFADTLCAKVATTAGPASATATAGVEKASIGLRGLPVIGVCGGTATSESTCTARSGDVGLTFTVAGRRVDVGDTPDLDVGLGVVGAELVVNEQVENGGDLTVDAVHLTAPGGIDIVIASATSAAHNCTA
ncbi:hypothetical protein [Streptomyces beihaiensis]|uniref:DUF320 domain-containing protein n=1 Tax=Streptomyces beihaiensis TaxID=2984495 RepID=A0ABT3U122_9ACTN|nr:hypothetical protein [Streptomyces beihaiensis]MCX3061945.1 hypothetical protein [Streptomyces beihaiensis]